MDLMMQQRSLGFLRVARHLWQPLPGGVASIGSFGSGFDGFRCTRPEYHVLLLEFCIAARMIAFGRSVSLVQQVSKLFSKRRLVTLSCAVSLSGRLVSAQRTPRIRVKSDRIRKTTISLVIRPDPQ
jgi:hypothetical protein